MSTGCTQNSTRSFSPLPPPPPPLRLPPSSTPTSPLGLIILTLLFSVSAPLSVSPFFLDLYFCCSLFLSPLYLPSTPLPPILSLVSCLSVQLQAI